MIKSAFRQLLILVFLPIFLFACGIDVYYYLPQLSEGNITTELNTFATIVLPSLSEDYARGYSIYYRVYISDFPIDTITTQSEMNSINPLLTSDWNALSQFTNPINYSQLPTSNTFRNRNYHEMQLENESINNLLAGGITFNLSFPPIIGERPTLIIPGRIDTATQEEFSRNLFRNSGDGNNNGINFDPKPDRYFFYSTELVNETNHTLGINNDIALRNTGVSGHAYVSMYIVAVGSNPTNFSQIYSKPTHIGVFKLPDVN